MQKLRIAVRLDLACGRTSEAESEERRPRRPFKIASETGPATVEGIDAAETGGHVPGRVSPNAG